MEYSVLLVAAGKQAGKGESYEKAFAAFNDSKSVLAQTLSVFLIDEHCKQIVIVASPADMKRVVVKNASGKVTFVKGGSTRQESVLIGLMAVSQDVVLIHDGVRPWITQELIHNLLGRMETEKACVLALRPQATLHKVENGYLAEVVDIQDLVLTQTPQAFSTNFIISCYQKAVRQGVEYLDDAAVVRAVSDAKIAVEEGDIRNVRFIQKK